MGLSVIASAGDSTQYEYIRLVTYAFATLVECLTHQPATFY